MNLERSLANFLTSLFYNNYRYILFSANDFFSIFSTNTQSPFTLTTYIDTEIKLKEANNMSHYGGGFALLVVLFILLVIVGAAYIC